jgi:hypothetical protein
VEEGVDIGVSLAEVEEWDKNGNKKYLAKLFTYHVINEPLPFFKCMLD